MACCRFALRCRDKLRRQYGVLGSTLKARGKLGAEICPEKLRHRAVRVCFPGLLFEESYSLIGSVSPVWARKPPLFG